MKLKVDSIWQGKAAIRDKYYADAVNEGLVLEYRGKIMTIPKGMVEKKMAFKSKQPFKDRYSNTSHYLYYFNWREDSERLENLEKIVKQPQLGV